MAKNIATDILRGILPQLLEGNGLFMYSTVVSTDTFFFPPKVFFGLMKQLEHEELLKTLQVLIQKFSDDMAPFAVALIHRLTENFIVCLPFLFFFFPPLSC